MTEIELKRILRTPFTPTFGVLHHGMIPFAVTLERPWLGNQRSISCIPDGEYRCLRCRVSPDYNGDSPRFGNTFQIYKVPRRKYILFHGGNITDDTHGCIIVGEKFGHVGGQLAVQDSRAGLKEFLKIMKGEDEFKLRVTNHYQ